MAFSDNIEKTGRRAAIVSSNPTPLQHGLIDADDTITTILKASGRWVEAVVPVGDGSDSIMVATLYGISGANQSQQKYNENEILIAAALVRMLSFNTPYYLTGDMNVIISKSGAIQKFIQAGFVVDLPRVWTPTEEEAQLTFSPLQYHTTGEGTSRIDTVLSNYTGSLSVIAVEYLYELGNGCDHLPIQVTLDLQVYTSTK